MSVVVKMTNLSRHFALYQISEKSDILTPNMSVVVKNDNF